MASVHPYETGEGKRYRVRWRQADGKMKSKTFIRAKDAQAFALDQERREQMGTLYNEEPMTFGEFAGLSLVDGKVEIDPDEGWFARYKQTVRPTSYARRTEAKQHLAELIPMRIDRINAAIVEDLVYRVGRTRPRQGKYLLETIKMVMRAAKVRGQRVDEAVVARPKEGGITPPKSEQKERVFLTLAQMDALAAVSEYPRMIEFLCLTGLRTGELFALTDADVAGDAIQVTKTADKFRGTRQTKTKAGRRMIPITRQLRKLILEQQMARPTGATYLFPSPSGDLWWQDRWNKMFRRWAKKAGLPEGTTPHSLRHTFASWMIKAGVDPKTLQTILGHESIRITMDIYGHLFDGQAATAMKRLERMLREEERKPGAAVAR